MRNKNMDGTVPCKEGLQHTWKFWRFRVCVYGRCNWKISRGTLDLGRLRIRYASGKWHPINETTLAINDRGKLWDVGRLVDAW